MQKTQGRLDELKGRTETSKNLLFETEVLAPQMMAEEESSKERQPIFKVRRQGGDVANEVTINQDTIVEPGDTIMVELPPRRETSLSVPLPALGGSSTTPTASIDVTDRLR
jgi:hypothetical protein